MDLSLPGSVLVCLRWKGVASRAVVVRTGDTRTSTTTRGFQTRPNGSTSVLVLNKRRTNCCRGFVLCFRALLLRCGAAV